jgi:hypothetical protein
MVEKYIPGYSHNATSFMANRSVDSHAAFFKSYLQSQSLVSMSSALREWSQHPDGLFAQAWCEAVGQK